MKLATAAAGLTCCIIFTGLGLSTALPATDDAAQTAQTLIFDAPHLKSTQAPSDIYYSYSFTNQDEKTFGKSYQDTVRLHIADAKPETPGKDATLHLYTGERQREPLQFADRLANPVILMFLEQDLWHMRQRIGGEINYFKGRVAAALRDNVKVETASAKVAGRDVPMTRITVKPFEKDPNAARLQAYTTKTYEFVISNDVPGQVLELKTTVYDPAAKEGKPLIQETLVFDRVENKG